MSDPLGARPPRPAPRGLLLKAAVVIPDVIISSLLWLVMIAALPTTVGLAVTLVGIALGALLAAGLGEDAVVRVLYRARRATPAEVPRLTVAWRIATHHLGADGVRLRIVSSGSPVATAGRRHLLLQRDVVDAYRANDLNAHQVAALIAEGIARLRHGHVRFDLLWTVWTIPWDFLRGIAHAIGRRLAWIPLVQFAWRTRIIVGTIAVVLEAEAGRWPSPIVIVGFITLSYLMPLWRRAWDRRFTKASDRNVEDIAMVGHPVPRAEGGSRQPTRPACGLLSDHGNDPPTQPALRVGRPGGLAPRGAPFHPVASPERRCALGCPGHGSRTHPG